MNQHSLHLILNALCIAAALGGVAQLLYWLLLYSGIYRRNRSARRGDVHFTAELQPLSVIIYTHDECRQLKENLCAVLEQDYPQYEVIVISDSHDDTDLYLTQLEGRYTHLYHSFVPDSSRYISRKKLALTLGIKAAKYEWLVMTDARCLPAGGEWLRTLARNFTPHTDVVLGYSTFRPAGSLSARIMAYCRMLFSLRYLCMAQAGMPYMGTGYNLAYRKSLFFKHKGFSAHLNLQRGDDDLFLNQVMTAANTRVETSPEAVMTLPAPAGMHDWHEEHIGYTSTARLYRGAHRYLTGGETATRLLFHLACTAAIVVALCLQQWALAGIMAGAAVVHRAVQAAVINLTLRAVGDPRHYSVLLPLLDWLQPCYSLRWKLSCRLRHKSDFLRR